MIGLSRAEQRLKERIGEDAVIEDPLEAVKHLLAARMLEKGRHRNLYADGGSRDAGILGGDVAGER